MGYDFKSLSPIDFEQLICDLLQIDLGVNLEIFKSGRDGGIDLRYISDLGNQLIVQCKHYANSTFSKLKSDLINKELIKVRKLNPSRYVIVTSLGLTPNKKDELKSIFTAICEDVLVYGNDDINTLLRNNPEVEKSHIKLWLSSTSVLERILNNDIYNRSLFTIEQIIDKSKFYVQNKSYPQAMKILKENNCCIIAGIPGIGKSTLAEMLIAEYMGRDYQVFKISNDMNDAEKVYNPMKKQIFYYDDFLGQTSLSVNKGEEKRIWEFIEKIRRSKNGKFILTTREYILNQAKAEFDPIEKIDERVSKCVIDLGKYTKLNRAEILYNHVYFSKLTPAYKMELLDRKNYMSIIEHPNYSPRIISEMTVEDIQRDVSSGEYLSTFLENLTNPLKVWKRPYEKLTHRSQRLLKVMASLPDQILYEDLEYAFDYFHELQCLKYGDERDARDFEKALEECENNFIRINKMWGSSNMVSFHNPSVRDFLENYLVTNPKLLRDLLTGVFFYEQCIRLWSSGKKDQNEKSVGDVVRLYLDEFLESIGRTFSSDVGSYHLGVEKKVRFLNTWITYTKRKRSAEDRLLFILGILESQSDRGKELVSKLFATLISRLRNNQGDAASLYGLLTYISKRNLEEVHGEFIDVVKKYLIDHAYWIEDFYRLVEITKIFPNMLTKEDIENLLETFEEQYGGQVEDIVDNEEDPSTINRYAEALQEVSRFFDHDAYHEIRKLEERAEEVERELEDEEEEETEPEVAPVINHTSEDDEIHYLFQSLIDEVVE